MEVANALERTKRVSRSSVASLASHCPHATPKELVQTIVELRKEHPSGGPKKLKARLEKQGMEGIPAESTMGHLLKKQGLIHPRRRRVYSLRMPSQWEVASLPNGYVVH